MKVVVINDCAHVGETLISHLPNHVETIHLKRPRSFFGKTAKLAWRIRKSKGDLYHCHYLLQDCWLTLKLGKHPIIGHAHGSDIRISINHLVWGRIVHYNLKHCDKIIVATPNLLETAERFNSDSEYIPNPVSPRKFHVKPRDKMGDKIRVLIAGACDWKVKGTDKIVQALHQIEREVEPSIINHGIDAEKTIKLMESLGMHINVLPPVPHHKMAEYYWGADVVIASIGVGGTLGMVALEAIACGRPVVAHVSSDYTEYKTFPILNVNTPSKIADAILEFKDEKLWEKEYDYFQLNHNPEEVSRRFMKIYSSLMS